MRIVCFKRQPVTFETIIDPKKVERMEIAFCDVESLEGIHRLTHLTEVHIHYCRSLSDISQLGLLRRLRQINLYSLPNVELEFEVTKLKHLESLSYTNVARIASIHGIESLKKLSYLGLSRVKVLDGDYMPIIKCKSLKRVFWHDAPFKAPAMNEIRELRPDILVGGNSARPSKSKKR
jgi:hypothetical protein